MGGDEFTAMWAGDQATAVDPNLASALQVAVPLRMLEIRDWTTEQQMNDAAWVLELMRAGAGGDELLYGVKNGRPAKAFTVLTRGLAALAYVEGGVDFAGLHLCAARHEKCPNGPQWTHLPEVTRG